MPRLDLDAPALPPPPDDLDDSGLVGVSQAKCRSGFFGVGQTMLCTMGMSVCSCVALHYTPNQHQRFGALMHYDGSGNPNELLDQALADAGFNAAAVRGSVTVYLAYHPNHVSETAIGAHRALADGGYPAPATFKHNGSAALDARGRFFDHFGGAEEPTPRAAKSNRRKAGCTIL